MNELDQKLKEYHQKMVIFEKYMQKNDARKYDQSIRKLFKKYNRKADNIIFLKSL